MSFIFSPQKQLGGQGRLAFNKHMSFTDIRFDVVERLPLAARPYALLMRLDRPIGWWLLLLPGWWGIMLAAGGINGLSGYDWYLLILFFFGAIIMRGAGCVINDLWDRDLDAKVERTRSRPLASGAVKPWHAGIFLFLLLFVGLIILVQTSAMTFWIGVLSMVFVVSYPYMKRITWWPQAFLGITFNFGALMGWAAVQHELGWPAILIYAGAFFWTLGYDTIYAHQDKDDDQMIGIKSTALLFGERSKKYVGIFYALCWALLAGALFLLDGSILSQGLMLLPGVHLLIQVVRWKPHDKASSLYWFKSNRDCGILFFLSFVTVGL